MSVNGCRVVVYKTFRTYEKHQDCEGVRRVNFVWGVASSTPTQDLRSWSRWTTIFSVSFFLLFVRARCIEVAEQQDPIVTA